MSSIKATPLSVLGALELTSTVHADSRGQFYRGFCDEDLLQYLPEPFVVRQSNISHTEKKGTIRGLHFQRSPHAEGKLVRCVQGQVFDVVVDLRPDSPSFKQWSSVVLDSQKANMLYVPKGCGHGFQALNDNVTLLYLHDAPYCQEAEGGVHVADTTLNIDWPLGVELLGSRDKSLCYLD